jgi:hypothetical protein
MLNNRELAILVWLAVIVAWALTHRDVRASAVDVLRAFAEPKILVPLAFMAGWVVVEVWLGSRIGLWEPSLLSETAVWFVASGLVLFFNFGDASKQTHFFRRRAVAALAPVVLMQALLDAFVLSLPAEMVLQLVLISLVMIGAFAAKEARYRQIQNLTSGLLILIVLVLALRTGIMMATGWDSLDKGDLLRQAILPAWLTIGLLPFIYAALLYASYELTFLRVDLNARPGRKAPWENKLALLASLNLRPQEVTSFAGPWPRRIALASSFSEARDIVKHFRVAHRQPVGTQAEARS